MAQNLSLFWVTKTQTEDMIRTDELSKEFSDEFPFMASRLVGTLSLPFHRAGNPSIVSRLIRCQPEGNATLEKSGFHFIDHSPHPIDTCRYRGEIPATDSSDHKIAYYVTAIDYARNVSRSDTMEFNTLITAIRAEDNLIPKRFEIMRLWPNPTNGDFIVRVAMPRTSEINITVYNILGQQVWQKQEMFPPGYHDIHVPASFSSGHYFIRIHSKLGQDVIRGTVVR